MENVQPDIDNRQWGVSTIAIRQQYNYGFGISKAYLDQLIPLLVTEGFYTPEPGEDGFTLKHLRATIQYLKEKNLFEPDIAKAVEKLIRQQTPEPNPSVKPVEPAPAKHQRPVTAHAEVQKMQLALHSFLSPNPPFGVIIDGKWGPLTDRAYDFITDAYNLLAATPTAAVTEQLETISRRIVRLRCKNSNIIDAVPHNPFCIIHMDASEFELTSEGVVTRLGDKKKMVRFNGLPEKDAAAALAFNAFSAWFMLLNMRGSEEGRHTFGNFSLDQMNDNLLPPQNIINKNAQQRFITEPQYVLEFKEKKAQVSIDFGDNDEHDIIGVLLSKNMKISITKGHRTELKDKGLAIRFDFEDFFNAPPLDSNLSAVPLLQADYLKLFIVKKDYTSNVKESGYKNIPGVEVTADFYKLITASDADILATNLIGLSFSEPPQPTSFHERVEKLYDEQPVKVSDDLQKDRWGGQATRNGKLLKAGVKKIAPWSYAVTVTAESATRDQKLEGEIAFFLHNTFSNEIRYETAVKGKAQISFTAYEAFTVGAFTEDGTMLELDLNEVRGFPKGFYYTDVSEAFKKKTEELYRNQPVTVKNDPQKNRWGGKSIAGGKLLEAEVEKSRLPRNYKVTIRVRFENSIRPLTGDVAFFLHDSFKEIRYRKAIDGVATITLNAYEDFTVGAYTADGTMLELDMNAVKGYPEGFYYKEKRGK